MIDPKHELPIAKQAEELEIGPFHGLLSATPGLRRGT